MSRSPWPAVIAVGVLLMVSFGSILYGFSIYVTDGSAGADFSSSMLSFAFTGSVVVSGLVAAPLGRWMDNHGTRRIAAVGGLVTLFGMLAFSFADSAIALLAAWWLLIGPGTAMTYYEPAFVVINQTVDSAIRPRALGVVTVIGGFAGAIFIPLVEVMNSTFGWRMTVRLLGVVIAVLGVVGSQLIPRRVRADVASAERGGPPLREVLADRRFLLLTAGMVLLSVAFGGLIAHRVDRFTEAGFDIETVALLAGAASLISLPGRFFGPVFGGRGQAARVLAWFAAIVVVATALTIPSGPGWFMPAHFVIYGIAFGAILPLRALAMDQWYGRDHYGRRMGIQQTATLVIGGLGPLLVGVLRDVSGEWFIPMLVMTIFAVTGLTGFVLAQRAHLSSASTG
ncbi:MAG: MFS transporter [Acidimicrobiia bacterium]|nr:MFS transporter [Acidimicrobiia bacterium]